MTGLSAAVSALKVLIKNSGGRLGPATVTKKVEYVQVHLTDRGHQAVPMSYWVRHLEVPQLRAGQWKTTDQEWMLHLRGMFRSGVPVVVTAAWPVGSPQADYVLERLERTDAWQHVLPELVRIEKNQ